MTVNTRARRAHSRYEYMKLLNNLFIFVLLFFSCFVFVVIRANTLTSVVFLSRMSKHDNVGEF